MLCRACGRMNRDEDLFCAVCGQKLMRTRICRACGTKNRPDSLFCGTCGVALPDDPASCVHCGHALGPRDHFCAECGHQVSAGRVCQRCYTFHSPDARYCTMCGATLAVAVTA